MLCSSMENWRTLLATAVFAVFFWAVMTGACGQRVLYGELHAEVVVCSMIVFGSLCTRLQSTML